MAFQLKRDQDAALRQMQGVFAMADAAKRAPIVMWSKPQESETDFATRVTEVRTLRSGPLLAAIPVGFKVPEGAQRVEFPMKLHGLLSPHASNPVPSRPEEPIRFRCASGGRGSGKSTAMANAVLLRVLAYKQRVLCAREIMLSLRQSVHALLVARIEALRLQQYFVITVNTITCANGSEIIFAGLHAHLDSIKSLNDLSLAWVEEAESVSTQSIQVLTPTIRGSHLDQGQGAEVWLSCNPDSPEAVAQEFVEGKRPDCVRAHVTYSDNPFFPSTLDAERLYLQKVDLDRYEHVWMGACSRVSDALIFRGKYAVEEFVVQPGWSSYVGLDFGFSQDPSAAVRCHVVGTELFISAEFWALKVELDQLSDAIERAIPGSREQRIHCDASRPESVSYLKQHGHTGAVSAPKWSGSILDGISFLRSFTRIIVAPDCRHMLDELRSYSFKIDRLTGTPLIEPQDKDNHLCDALRYAMSDLITKKEPGILAWYAAQQKPAPAPTVQTNVLATPEPAVASAEPPTPAERMACLEAFWRRGTTSRL